MEGPMERYLKLGLRDSLSRSYHYAIACKELSFILRAAYSQLPKNLQSLIFQDILTAFRLLPQMLTQTAVLAANLLLESAQAAFPKQKWNLAAKEFKHTMVIHKRRCKVRQEEEGLGQIPQDILVHIFSFLDFRSLASAAAVCWSWNTASSENSLWQLQYVSFFGNSDNCVKVKVPISGRIVEIEEFNCLEEDVVTGVNTDWRDAFTRAYKVSSKKLTYRGYCWCCDAIVWLSNMKCSNEYCRPNCKNHQVKPLSNQQIVYYILDDPLSIESSSSDSDSDSDEASIFKMWAYRRRISKQRW